MFNRRSQWRFWMMLLVTGIIAGTGWLFYSVYYRVKPLTPETEARLAEIIVPKFNVEGDKLEDALAVLQAACAAKGVRFQVWKEAQLPVEVRASLQPRAASSQPERFKFYDLPVRTSLRVLADSFDLPVAERTGTVLVFPDWQGEVVGRLRTRTFPFTFGPIPPGGLENYLRAAGISLKGGGSAQMVSGGTRIRVRATVEDLDLCEAVLYPTCELPKFTWEDRMWQLRDAGANLLK